MNIKVAAFTVSEKYININILECMEWRENNNDLLGSGREGQGVWTPLKNHKVIGFSKQYCPGSLKNHKAIKSAFNVGLSSARQ